VTRDDTGLLLQRATEGGTLADAPGDDQRALDALVRDFLAAFTNTHGKQANVRRIYELALPSAVITKATSGAPDIYSLREFVEPRQELLSGGSLLDFEEAEVSASMQIAGNVAQRYSIYRKTGVQSGQPFQTLGVKVWQFVRMPSGWRLSALSWDDERDGFVVPVVAGT
jgi:hypothetical protein